MRPVSTSTSTTGDTSSTFAGFVGVAATEKRFALLLRLQDLKDDVKKLSKQGDMYAMTVQACLFTIQIDYDDNQAWVMLERSIGEFERHVGKLGAKS